MSSSLISTNFAPINNIKEMRKTVQEKEIEKLKNKVEKLKNEKAALMRDKRNLKCRLSTAKSNAEKYRSELKKKNLSEGSDENTFERMMSLLDAIITRA